MLSTMTNVWARGRVDQERVIETTYPLSADGRLELNNKFGAITIRSWDKPTVALKATIRVWGRNEKQVEEVLAQLDVKHTKSGRTVRFETIIDYEGDNNISERQGFEIEYEIQMPATPELEIENKFGAVSMGDHTGAMNIELKFGSLRAARLTGANRKNIQVSFGSADIDELAQGELIVKHGSATVGKVKKAYLEVKHGSLEVEEGDDLETLVKHGRTQVGTVRRLRSESAFGSFEVARLLTSAIIETKHGSCDVGSVAAGFEELEIESAFGSVKIDFEKTADFRFTIETDFGGFSSSLPNGTIRRDIEEQHNREVEGSYGKGRARVSVEAKHGNIRFR